MRLIYLFLCIIWYLYQCEESCAVRVSYISTEYPKVTYVNHTIMKYCNTTSLRVNRKDPRHYVTIKFETLVPIGNNVSMSFSFYEFLTNKYENSFLEIHNRLCDFIEVEPIFGSQIKKNMMRSNTNITCPLPPGQYQLTDMAIPFVPKNLPFQKGRIYVSTTMHINAMTYTVVQGYIEMELKQMRV